MSKGNSFDEFTVAQLIEDISEGAFAGVIGFSETLGFLDRVIQNAGPSSGYWDAIFNVFKKMEAILHNTKHYDSLSVFISLYL